jgi:hypothetical protein
MRQGRRNSGIVVSSQRLVGDVVRRLLRLARAKDAAALCDQLEFLGDW